MAFLALENITKRFGQHIAVDQVDLQVEQGEFLTLLGPSGCGKTTILRMIAGFETPGAGTISLDGADITSTPANKRPIGMVFQSYALFPHMTATQNIAFGMSIKRQPRQVIRQRCAELLELVGLSDKGENFPHQLSGGQQQRIAIARALAVEPRLLLLDEPLSALDARVRVSLRNEIRRIQQQLKITAIYVTHDQEEALAISDRIAVISRGKIEQLDQPEAIYNQPRSVFAATFVGISNRFEGQVESAESGLCRVGSQVLHVPTPLQLTQNEQALILVRPEAVTLQQQQEDGNTTRAIDTLNQVSGTIVLRTFLGPFTRFHVQTSDANTLLADIPNQQAHNFHTDQQVTLSFPPSACQVLPLHEQARAV